MCCEVRFPTPQMHRRFEVWTHCSLCYLVGELRGHTVPKIELAFGSQMG